MSGEESRKKLNVEGEDPKKKKKVAFQMKTYSKKVTVAATATQTTAETSYVGATAETAHVGAGDALMAAIEKCKPPAGSAKGGEEAAPVPQSQNEDAPSKDLSMPLL